LKDGPGDARSAARRLGVGDVTDLVVHPLDYYHGQVGRAATAGMDAMATHNRGPARDIQPIRKSLRSGCPEAAAAREGIDVVVASADPGETGARYIHDFHRGALKLIATASAGCSSADRWSSACGPIVGELVLAISCALR